MQLDQPVKPFQPTRYTMQVALVVRDLETEMKWYWEVFKIGPWDIWNFTADSVQDYIYRGKPASHSCLIACAWFGDTQLELIQSTGGYSIYDEHLEKHGEGAPPHQAILP